MTSAATTPDTTRPYHGILLPGLVGILVGAALTWTLEHGVVAPAKPLYFALPEFRLWQLFMIAQFAVYFSAWTYLSDRRRNSPYETDHTFPQWFWWLGLLVIAIPGLLDLSSEFPVGLWQRLRMTIALLFALPVLYLIVERVGQIYTALTQGIEVAGHRELREDLHSLLAIAGTVVTLGALMVGATVSSMIAFEGASPSYDAPMGPPNVIAYGGYYSVLLALVFVPVLQAERSATQALLDAGESVSNEDGEAAQGSVFERLSSSAIVLSPLIGAVFSNILGG